MLSKSLPVFESDSSSRLIRKINSELLASVSFSYSSHFSLFLTKQRSKNSFCSFLKLKMPWSCKNWILINRSFDFLSPLLLFYSSAHSSASFHDFILCELIENFNSVLLLLFLLFQFLSNARVKRNKWEFMLKCLILLVLLIQTGCRT